MRIRSAIIFCLLLKSGASHAKDSWLCTEASSQRFGQDIHSCGIGLGKDEAEARLKAFDSAKAEFNKVCDSSDDCKGHEITVDPKRTTCEQTGTGFKCYRMIVFSIRDSLKPQYEPTNKAELHDRSLVHNAPILKKGMSKQDLFASFGTPQQVVHAHALGGNDYLQIFYRGRPFCDSGGSCYVIVEDNKVQSYEHFNPEFTDDMQ